MGAGRSLHAPLGDVGDIVIDQPIERHDPANGPLRDLRLPQEAPDPELAGIGMRLLEVIDLHHERQPDLAGRRALGLGSCPAVPRSDRPQTGESTASTVGRETFKNRLILSLSQP